MALSVPITPTARDVDSPVKVPPLFSRVKWLFTFFFFFKLERRNGVEQRPTQETARAPGAAAGGPAAAPARCVSPVRTSSEAEAIDAGVA